MNLNNTQSPLNTRIDSYLLEVLDTDINNRLFKAISRISKFIKTLHTFITYLHPISTLKENKDLLLLSTQFEYNKLKHNSVLKKACEKVNNFYLIKGSSS